MTNEAVALLRELHSSGETGIVILILLLVVIGAAAFWMLHLQKRWISTIETQMKAADAVREESRSAQEISSRDIISRVDSVIKINDELRKEVDRLAQQQKSFKDSQNMFRATVRRSIDDGLAEIRDRLTKISVEEILAEVPEAFKTDLERTLSDLTRRVINSTIDGLRAAPGDLVDQAAIVERVREAVHSGLDRFEPGYGWLERRGSRELDMFTETLAQRIAYYLRNRYI